MAESLENHRSPNYKNMDIEFSAEVIKYVRKNMNRKDQSNIDFVAAEEVDTLIKSTKKNRAAGRDQIPDFTLHTSPQLIIVFITNNINNIFRLTIYFIQLERRHYSGNSKTWKKFAENS